MRRRWLFWALAAVLLGVTVARFGELEQLAVTLSLGRWPWVVAAALLQLGYYLVFAALYRAAFLSVGVGGRLLDLVPVVFGSLALAVAIPSGGLSAAALFADDAARRGEPAVRAAAGVLLVQLAQLGVFVLILAAALAHLGARHELAAYQVAASGILLLLVAGMVALLALAARRPEALRRVLAGAQGAVNRLGGRFGQVPLIAEGWAERSAAEFSAAARAVARHPDRLVRMLAVAGLGHLLNLATILALFPAFRAPIDAGALVAGYAMCYLFAVVAITPVGIGVVEGVTAVVYTSLGVPASAAAIISLAFRGLAFWLPLLVGLILLRRLRSFTPDTGRSER